MLDHRLQAGYGKRQNDGVARVGFAVGHEAPRLAVAPLQLLRGLAQPKNHALFLQVARERRPDGVRERLLRDVEHQSLGVSREVEVEHHQELGGRHVGFGIEEGVREDVEKQAARFRWKTQRIEIVRCGVVIPTLVRALRIEPEHLERATLVDAYEIAKSQGARAQRQGDDVLGRPTRQPREGLFLPLWSENRIVLQRSQEIELRIDAAQQRLQVVVLAKEGVEAALHLERLPRCQRLRPSARAAAEKLLALDQCDSHATLGENRRCRNAGNSSTHDDDAVIRVHALEAVRMWKHPLHRGCAHCGRRREEAVNDAALPAVHGLDANGHEACGRKARAQLIDAVERHDAVTQVTEDAARPRHDGAEWDDDSEGHELPHDPAAQRSRHRVLVQTDGAAGAQQAPQSLQAQIGVRNVTNTVSHQDGVVRTAGAVCSRVHGVAVHPAGTGKLGLGRRVLQHSCRCVQTRETRGGLRALQRQRGETGATAQIENLGIVCDLQAPGAPFEMFLVARVERRKGVVAAGNAVEFMRYLPLGVEPQGCRWSGHETLLSSEASVERPRNRCRRRTRHLRSGAGRSCRSRRSTRPTPPWGVPANRVSSRRCRPRRE